MYVLRPPRWKIFEFFDIPVYVDMTFLLLLFARYATFSNVIWSINTIEEVYFPYCSIINTFFVLLCLLRFLGDCPFWFFNIEQFPLFISQ